MVETSLINDSETQTSDIQDPTVDQINVAELDLAEVEKTYKLLRSETCSGQFYSRAVHSYRLLSKEESLALSRQGDDEARHKLVLHNLRLVFFVANKFLHRGLDLNDLVQEGNLGLLKAAIKYDHNFNCTFSTYAIWWIKAFMQRAIEKHSKTIRLPSHIYELRSHVRKTAIKLSEDLGRRPTIDEIASALKVSKFKVIDTFNDSGTVAFSIDETVEFKDGHQSKHEFVPDARNLDPAHELVAKEEVSVLGADADSAIPALRHLNVKNRDVEIFKMFYNLETRVKIYRTLESVGQQFNLTRERIRLIVKGLWGRLEAYDRRFTQVRLSLEVLQRNGVGVEDIAHGSASTIVELLKTDIHRGSNGGGQIKLTKPSKCRYFRASPALVNWVPSEADLKSRIFATLHFVGEAYEIAGLKPPGGDRSKGVERWAQNVFLFLLTNVFGTQVHEIKSVFPDLCLARIRASTALVLAASHCKAHVKEDIDLMRSHLQKVMPY